MELQDLTWRKVRAPARVHRVDPGLRRCFRADYTLAGQALPLSLRPAGNELRHRLPGPVRIGQADEDLGDPFGRSAEIPEVGER
jgi:hypothetical protein